MVTASCSEFKVLEWERDGDRQDIYPHQPTQVNIQAILTRPAVCYNTSPTSLNSHPLSDSSSMCQSIPANRDHSVRRLKIDKSVQIGEVWLAVVAVIPEQSQ